MRICLATPDFIGPVRNGGVGTAFLGLAETLRDAGHDVDVFYTSDNYEEGDCATWSAHYASRGIRFYSLPTWETAASRFPDIVQSSLVYEHLKSAEYDIVHFPDYRGFGFHTAQAAALGRYNPNTAIIATLHAPGVWSRQGNSRGPISVRELVGDAMERGLVRLADAVISPSRYILDWLKNEGWHLPPSHLIFNRLPAANQSETHSTAGANDDVPARILELVFFGRLEPRKGIHVFIDAINLLLDRSHGARIEVTFLGKFNPNVLKPEILGLRTRGWPLRWRVLDHLASSEALEYLAAAPNRVAIIPSLMDNSPCVIVECLLRRIPFLAFDVGGVSELIAAPDRPRVLVPPSSIALADAIHGLFDRKVAPASISEQQADSAARLVAVHEAVAAEKRSRASSRFTSVSVHSAQPGNGEAPLVSVCMLHRNRHAYLKQALDGYENQSFRNFEVIVVDNGSTVEESIAFLDGLQGGYTFPLRVLRLDGNLFKEGGRNAAVGLARGTWLKFHDDDNVPKPNELEALSEAMATGNADAISCSLDMFEGEEAPDASTVIAKRIVFLGEGGAAAFIENFMGDTNFIVSRAAFEAVGGFDDPGQHLPADDWVFLAKLRCKGYRVATLPDALVWYRVSSQADELNWIRNEKSPRSRVLQLLAGPLASDVRQVLGLAQMTN